jgi:predicted permease
VYADAVQQIVDIIAPTFFAIVLGYVFGRVSRASPVVLIDVALYIATPCLVLTSLLASPIVVEEAVWLWLSCLMTIAGPYVLARLILWRRGSKHSGFYLPVMFGNLINIPLPIVYLAFGTEGVANAILFYVPQAFLIYSLAVYIAAGQAGLRQGLHAMVRMPLLYAAILGIVLNLAGVTLPSLIDDSLSFMGRAAVPIFLLVLGMTMTKVRLSHLPLSVLATVLRMGGGFVFGALAVWLFDLTGMQRAIVLFQSAMPAAILTAALCTKYKNEAELVSSVVFMSTMLSIVVVPVLLYFLM